MVRSGLLILTIVMFTATFHGGVQARGSSPAPLSPVPSVTSGPSMETPLAPSPASTDCTAVLIDDLMSCLTYVQAGSNLTRPEKGCCPGLAALVNSQPICLCTLLANSDTFGIKLDRTKALTLPTVCRVETPPVSVCSAVGIPVPSPEASTPSPSSGDASVGSTPSTGQGEPAASPPTGSGVNPTYRSSVLTLLAGLLLAVAAVF